jgi:cobalt transporter subunit CbtB
VSGEDDAVKPLGNREGTLQPVTRKSGDLPDRSLTWFSRRVKMTAKAKTVQYSGTFSIPQRLAVGLTTLLFGAFMLYGVGLAQDSRMHNAAHDTRHSIGFPCH